MKAQMISLELKMTKEVYQTLTSAETKEYQDNRFNKESEEIERDLIKSNSVSNYVIYGGDWHMSTHSNCKMVSIGIELGMERFECYFNDILIYTFNHYVAMGFSSQPHYLELNYTTYSMLLSKGVHIERYRH